MDSVHAFHAGLGFNICNQMVFLIPLGVMPSNMRGISSVACLELPKHKQRVLSFVTKSWNIHELYVWNKNSESLEASIDTIND